MGPEFMQRTKNLDKCLKCLNDIIRTVQ